MFCSSRHERTLFISAAVRSREQAGQANLLHLLGSMSDIPANRPPASASGTLAKTPAIHLLLYALEKSLGGTVEFTDSEQTVASLLFVGGRPAKARTRDPVSHLGRVLLELGYLSSDQLTRSLTELARAKGAGRALHGQVLLASRTIDNEKLQAGLCEQLARMLRHIAALPPVTTFAYYEGFDGLAGWGLDASQGFDPIPMVWGMLRENPPMAHVAAALERVTSSRVRLVRGVNLGRLGLVEEPARLAEQLARPMTFAEVMQASEMGEAETRLVVYLLLVTKQVDLLRVEPAASFASPSRPTPAPSADRQASASPSVARQVPASPSADRQVPASPSADRQVTASPSADRQVSAPAPSVGRQVSGPQSADRQASASPSAGRQVSQSAERQVASVPRTPVPPATTTPSPPAPNSRGGPASATTSQPRGLSPEVTERWNEIRDRAATIDRTDYFSMLGLAHDATLEDVEAAFFTLAKKWHPDRLSSELAAVRAECSRVFARMSEAHTTLSDSALRAQYMELLAEGSGSPDVRDTVLKVVEAATDFQKAEVCLRRSDYVQAETLCRKAHEADPTQPDYLAMLAWLTALKPENQTPEKTKEAIQMLDRAISMSGRSEKAHFWRGMLNKRLGKAETAFRDFKTAVDLNPRNIDAAREVRLHRMRRGSRSSSPPPGPGRSGPPPGSGRPSSNSVKPEENKPGLLGRLFKKQ
jgi:DnaJ-domain-containing protein 1